MFGAFKHLAKRPVGVVNTPLISTQKRFVSEKALRSRMVAIGNIKKITKAMKMVASAKVRRCEEALNITRAFSSSLNSLWPTQPVPDTESAPPATVPGKHLMVPVSPDRGLCGSVNGMVGRFARNRINWYLKSNRDISIVTIGEKVRPIIERNFSKNILLTIGDHSKLKRRTFKQTAQMADLVLSHPYDTVEFNFNQFKNMMSFGTGVHIMPNRDVALEDNATFEPYEVDDGDREVLVNLYDFSVGVRLHHIMAECDMVEFSQRVNSMTSSSKNAEEMLNNVRLLYNRCRQSRITTELIEIISGATAAADSAQN